MTASLPCNDELSYVMTELGGSSESVEALLE
jgi:hypothetical protein